jgi:dTDP-4-amino-4,6-dideoxygalactose transaminase
MKVPLLDLKVQHEVISGEIGAAVAAVLNGQHFILGPEVREIEEAIASYSGADYGIGCASGSDALLLAMMALGIGPGDEVVTTPFSFFATAGCIARLGAKPVFVDIEPGTFNIDAGALEQKIGPKTRAILPVHLFGQCAAMDRIDEIASAHGIPVIEDAAQSIGADFGGRRAGGLGLMAAFSFYPSKNLGGAGDGGLITTSDAELAGKLRAMRAHGARRKYFHDTVGINSRLDTLQAAILMVKFRHLEVWTEARRRNAERYRRLLGESGMVDAGHITMPQDAGAGRHVYNQFVIRARRRDKLRQYLKERGVGTEIYYPLPLHLQDCFGYLGYKRGQLPVAELASEEAVAIPIYPELQAAAIDYVVDSIGSFYAGE